MANKKTPLSQESYSLNWLGKSYAKALVSDANRTLLAPNTAHNAKAENANSQNLLIKGDNLAVLKHLRTAYRNAVKMIYIDPPYNTGSDGFVYQDDRHYTAEQIAHMTGETIETAERIFGFIQRNASSHSAWLTFMYPRLKVARELLKDDGVIFISIDDNEQAQLKMLCDEVFGEENFVAVFNWQTKNAARGVPPVNMLMDNHEYIACYAKDSQKQRFMGIERLESDFSNPDNDPRGLWRSESIRATGSQNNFFSFSDKEGRVFEGNWAFSEISIKKMIEDDLIIFPKESNQTPRQKKFINSYKNDKKAFVSSLGWYSTEKSTKDLMNIFNGKKIFSFPKPLELIKFSIQQSTNPTDLILDFFAGSGTTAHAVMQLNAEDNGKRNYICVQLDETTDKKSEAFKAGYQTIFDITKARIEKAAAKIKTEHPEFDGDLGFQEYHLQDYPKGYGAEPESPQQALSQLEQGELFSQLDDAALTALLTTWTVRDGLPLTERTAPISLTGRPKAYRAHLAENRLYLMQQGFNNTHLADLLAQLDEMAGGLNIEKIIVFAHQFDSKSLREIEEAINQYQTRKGVHLYWEARYE